MISLLSRDLLLHLQAIQVKSKISTLNCLNSKIRTFSSNHLSRISRISGLWMGRIISFINNSKLHLIIFNRVSYKIISKAYLMVSNLLIKIKINSKIICLTTNNRFLITKINSQILI